MLLGNVNESYALLDEVSEKLQDLKNYFSGDIKNFELLTSLYLEIYHTFQADSWAQSQVQNFNIKDIIDPVELIQLKALFQETQN